MIRGVSNSFDVNFMYGSSPTDKKTNNQKASVDNTDDSKKGSAKIAKRVSATALSLTVLGAATYCLKSGKKANLGKSDDVLGIKADELADDFTLGAKTVIKKVRAAGSKIVEHFIEPNKEKGIANYRVLDGDQFVIEVEMEGYMPVNDLMEGGLERQIYTQWADGRTATSVDYLTPDKKIHERMTVKGNDIFRYDFAWQDGKVIGYAKEHTHHGFDRNISPMTVKMFDGREVKASDLNELYKVEPSFDPRLIK